MPSVSGKQHRLMELVAHNPAAAKRLGIKQSVGEDFAKADEGRHFPVGRHPTHTPYEMERRAPKAKR